MNVLAIMEDEGLTLDQLLRRVKRAAIQRALFNAGGNMTEAAKRLGRNRTELYRVALAAGVDVAAITKSFGRDKPQQRRYPYRHHTRGSDSSYYDVVCVRCGATDAAGDERLTQPCPGEPAA